MSSSTNIFKSPRHLVFRHGQRLLRSLNEGDNASTGLAPGEELLHSFYLPGLQTGSHTISVVQSINAGESKTLASQQKFNVVGPRFALPDNAIHSSYPPQGYQEMVECLPHVIFNDATFPWERVGSYNAENPHPPDYDRNRTPWLAVLSFTQDELKLPPAAMDPNTGIFTKVKGLEKGAVQGPTFSINMSVSQISNIQQTVSPVTYDETVDGAATSDMLLLPRALFTSLFSKYDPNGKPDASAPYVYHHRYLAHKRDINNQGMALSAAASEDDTGSFGVIFSHRSGPVDITAPTPVYVHLISIEGIEQMTPWPIADGTAYVAVSSLYSWSYLCLPPDTPTIRDEFVGLGDSVSLLSPTMDTKNPLFAKPGGPEILSRLQAGFTISRYRLQTGEQTACLIRGPFVPTQDPPGPPPSWWPSTSLTGTDLQILDQGVGIMDITYSAAWQLGRTMAIADQAFVAALGNVRKYINDNSRAIAQANALKETGMYKSREELLSSLPHTVESLQGLHKKKNLTKPNSMLHRWFRPVVKPLDMSYHGDTLAPYLAETPNQAAMDVSSTPDKNDPTKPSNPSVPYDEYNTPFSVDWVLVLRWVLDRLFFHSVPAHYLLTDASHLPPESLKFFRVDTKWTDAMIDGALSLGNHFYQQSDPDRDAIKAAIERYKTTPNSVLKYPPPLPKYGCFVRSALITKFPDIIVGIGPTAPAPTDAPILLGHEIIDPGTMLCLFSSMPSKDTWNVLTFTQPPHQQTFIAADHITGPTAQTIKAEEGITTIPADTIVMEYRRAYTIPDPSKVDDHHTIPLTGTYSWTMDETGASPMYVWTQKDPKTGAPYDVRTLLMDNLAPNYLTQLQAQMDKAWFDDSTATSALMAWQQNDPSYSLTINLSGSTMDFQPEIRSILPTRPSEARKPVPEKTCSTPPQFTTPVKHIKPVDRNSGEYSHPVLTVPPHRNAFRAIPLDRKEIGIGFPTKPVFQYTFSPTSSPAVFPSPGTIPMGGVAQDILFTIRLTDHAGSWPLSQIWISIPYGVPPTPGQPGQIYTLTNAPPTGAYMLSNLRFNPLISRSDDTNSLVIRLLPRSTNGYVPAAACNELNFVLTGVQVNTSSIQPYYVAPVITEYYTNQRNFPATGTPIMQLVTAT
ncbi:hypothetical protein TWF694_005837 [Orbilia ellipsospora]|uniref:Uncharacterized protein n=1 Tax=Orbilia ellipsospora TaxID=2528407 RepID=A0AAV9WS22_9PEZI